jgi:hypothetical protein
MPYKQGWETLEHNMIGNLKSETRKTRKLEAQISIFQRYESQTSHLDFANKRYTTLKWQANDYIEMA